MDLLRARELLISLANGVDPLTGELLPEESVCNKVEIVRAFHCILDALPDRPRTPRCENTGKPWTPEDDATLCIMFDSKKKRKDICAYFGRSEVGIASRLVRLGKIQKREQFYRLR